MTKKQKAAAITALLETAYPSAECALYYTKPHELLIATRLSAQCTDKRVNIVTPVLFGKFTSVEEFADAELSEVEECIKSCGLYKTKAKDIINMCAQLRDEYAGVVPDTIEELTKLSGVGRKTANLICGELYKKPAVVTDTHVIRLSRRLGLCANGDPYKVETALRKLLPPEKSMAFCHRLVWHGRLVCKARNPACAECTLSEYCNYVKTHKIKK